MRSSFGSAAAAEPFERLLPAIRRAKGLILDVRQNDGGDTKKASGRARLVGEASGGSTRQPLAIQGLPAGGSARICTKRDTVLERGLAELRARIGK